MPYSIDMAIEIINGVRYGTKEDAKAECLAYMEANPGGVLENYATHKCVRYGGVTRYRWVKMYFDGPMVTANPRMRGMWEEREGTKNYV